MKNEKFHPEYKELDLETRIKNYGMDVEDLDVSPFESLNMLHNRSLIEKNLSLLPFEIKVQLYKYDLKLIENSKGMVKHLEFVYDFRLSKEPLAEWWWHLDKIADESFVISWKVEPQHNS